MNNDNFHHQVSRLRLHCGECFCPIRPIVVGRKNMPFCDTEAGTNASVVIFTMLATTKANWLNPEGWLSHILSVLSDRFAQNTAASIDALMPLTNVMHQKFEK